MDRIKAENKKLTEMLTVMCENYNALRSQLSDYMSKNPEKELSPPRKRKSESSNNNDVTGIHGNSESSSTDEESFKKPREETIKAKISSVYFRTEASDTSLVSHQQICSRTKDSLIKSCSPMCMGIYFPLFCSRPDILCVKFHANFLCI